MKLSKRFFGLIAAALFTMGAWAQTMTFTFADGVTATASEMSDGSCLIQLPAGTNLNGAIKGVCINGTAVEATQVTPDPTKTFITEGEIETFVYNDKAYSFRFLAGEYFTVVMFGDPHVAESSGISVTDMQTMAANIVNMGKDGGKKVTFSHAPKGYIPTTDLVICLGDMDKDNETSGNDFNNAMKGFNDAQIPFITITGNHDLVPDIYWDSTNDYGLSFSGCANNQKALNLVKTQYEKAAGFGEFEVETITDPKCKAEVQVGHFTFKYKGVRFYCANSYWFQKPYDGVGLNILGKSTTTYAADGTIKALNDYVEAHPGEPAVWVSHYPFYSEANNYNDAAARWWLDQNNAAADRAPVCLWPVDAAESEFYNGGSPIAYTSEEGKALAEKKKKALADIIVKTKNPLHFSGHSHKNDDVDVTATNGKMFRDHTIKNFVNHEAFVVLCKEGEGVIEVLRVTF